MKTYFITFKGTRRDMTSNNNTSTMVKANSIEAAKQNIDRRYKDITNLKIQDTEELYNEMPTELLQNFTFKNEDLEKVTKLLLDNDYTILFNKNYVTNNKIGHYFYSKNGQIAYLQAGDYSGISISSVHRSTGKGIGTGYGILKDITNVNIEDLNKGFVFAPNWANGNDIKHIKKFTSIKEWFCNDSFNLKYSTLIDSKPYTKDWNEDQQKEVNNIITNYFAYKTFKDQNNNTIVMSGIFSKIDNILGLAYTSSSSFPMLGICNVNLYLDDEYYFNYIYIDTNYNVCISLQDDKEQEKNIIIGCVE